LRLLHVSGQAPDIILPDHAYVQGMIMTIIPVVGAIGYSMLYLLFGGGIIGAAVIFVVAKMFGK
jgi:hypothetical protein